jgi:hypothetical protein
VPSFHQGRCLQSALKCPHFPSATVRKTVEQGMAKWNRFTEAVS